MNLKEKLEEKGYHINGHDDTLVIYWHGEYCTTLYRYNARSEWRVQGRHHLTEEHLMLIVAESRPFFGNCT